MTATTNPWTGKLDTTEYHQLLAGQQTETQLQGCIINAAQTLGWLVYHTHDSRRSQPGFPDLVLVRGQQILYRELKTQTGRVRPEQRTWLDTLTAAGADAAIWRPIDWFTGHIARALEPTRTSAHDDLWAKR
jgi:hypothetical protein